MARLPNKMTAETQALMAPSTSSMRAAHACRGTAIQESASCLRLCRRGVPCQGLVLRLHNGGMDTPIFPIESHPSGTLDSTGDEGNRPTVSQSHRSLRGSMEVLPGHDGAGGWWAGVRRWRLATGGAHPGPCVCLE